MGVDGGGSKTSAVIINEKGIELGRSKCGASNYHLTGIEHLEILLKEVMQAAAKDAEIELSQISAVFWALAGAGRPAEAKKLERLRANMLPNIPGGVVTDALAALVGGIGTRKGVVLISGTGAIAYGENGSGKIARAGGWGHALDYGSGYSIAQEALRAIVAAEDGRDLPTSLYKKMQESLGIQNTDELVNWLYAPDRQVAEIALLAPQVLSSAEEGDLLATEILLHAAESLARSVATVSRRLGFEGKTFPLVLSGGLLSNSEFYRRLVSQAIRTKVPYAQPQLAEADAAVGAALLAREKLGYPLVRNRQRNAENGTTWASEERNLLTQNLDIYPSITVAGLMHLEDGRAVSAVRDTLPEIARAIDGIAERMRKGGRLIYVGAGTSGRLGTLDASECPPTFGTDPNDILCLIAGGEKALVQAFEGAEDDSHMGKQEIADLQVNELDSVIGIAASGRTPYVIGALAEARKRGALTASVICNLPAPLSENVDYVIAPLVGPEVLAGSTRLKAGTAQKLVLNMLSTGTMVRLGKTYGNLMVDVAQHNSKLQERARRIVAQACNVDHTTATEALQNTDRDVRAAIVQLKLGCDANSAKKYLAQAGRNIRLATENNKP
jgi:N-acetylmuramic acid 6-phosphate etherase